METRSAEGPTTAGADRLQFFEKSALLERLSKGLKRRSQEVVFLVGAPLSAPLSPDVAGVPGVHGVIALITEEFSDDPAQLSALNEALEAAGTRRYQAAFEFLQGRRGQHTVNEIVRKAVLAARIPGSGSAERTFEMGDDVCRRLEMDCQGWVLSPGTESLGKLAANYPDRFGTCILTTNFDPLIEVAIRRAGGVLYRTTLHSDGNLGQTEATGCHVVHLHGYWYGSDTLHTSRQLMQSRPHLRDSLGYVLRNKLVVVCAYSGWDDIFTGALLDVVRDDTAYPEVIWTFYEKSPTVAASLAAKLEPGVARGRVSLYSGVDCNHLFPQLHSAWITLENPSPLPGMTRSNPVVVTSEFRRRVEDQAQPATIVEGDDEDRPPYVEICVGRELELRAIRESKAKAVFLTGLGGQGKSTVAARYFSESRSARDFSIYVWRDCKEERERFENQLASVVEKLSGGRISGQDLAKQNAASIVEMLMSFIRDSSVLFVFDNVDHYVNLEERRLIAGPNIFVEALLRSETRSRAVFTCRPSVFYAPSQVLTCHLGGLDLSAVTSLFSARGASSTSQEIEDAHLLTEGHAFWLDLLAIQVAKRAPPVDLRKLVREIRSGGGPLPDNTLNSIWATLKEREQIVLREMAETVKPEREDDLAEYLSREMHYSKLIKAVNSLRALNLIVVKQSPSAPDVLELHPMVRQFIRRRFTPPERVSFIDSIIKVYRRVIGNRRSELSEHPPFSVLQYWTQGAELAVAAGEPDEAFNVLAEVAKPFLNSAYSREFCRVARLVLSRADWVSDHAKFKQFEAVFFLNVRFLDDLGEFAEVDRLLEEYERTVPEKDARYIRYCDMRCYSAWSCGDFSQALQWGKAGQGLKASGVDTKYGVDLDLALAERDAGHPEAALPRFLLGRALSDVIDPEELEEARGGDHYGNIGRCLHFMGQIDAALTCYQKSALLLEKDPHIVNQGFVRQWIGEVLAGRGQFKLAEAFFRAAYLKWEHASPRRSRHVMELAGEIEVRAAGSLRAEDSEVEEICRAWIFGRSVDAEYR